MFLLYIMAFVFGVLFGNFATTFIYRICNNKPIAGRYFRGIQPHCSFCGHELKFYEYLPLLHVVTLGKCRYCKVKIPFLYFFTEYGSGVLSVMLYHIYNFGLTYVLLQFSILLVYSFVTIMSKAKLGGKNNVL